MEHKQIYVVGAIILAKDKIFCAQRSPTMTLPYYWEFPGGKIETGETPEAALIREVQEEFTCEIAVLEYFDQGRYQYDFGRVIIDTYLCAIVQGEPIKSEHMDAKWVQIADLQTLEWAPADVEIIDRLRQQWQKTQAKDNTEV